MSNEKPNKIVNAFWQVALITSSVLLAFAINSWNDNRKNRNIQIETLKAIESSIFSDLVDMRANEEGYGNTVDAFRYIRTAIQSGQYATDSLNVSLAEIINPSFFIANQGPYETLKSRGLETVEDDSLRNLISGYYQFSHQVILKFEGHYLQNLYSVMYPFVMNNFDFTGSGAEPIDLEKLRNDRTLSGKMGYGQSLAGANRGLYINEIAKAEQLRTFIHKEIGILER